MNRIPEINHFKPTRRDFLKSGACAAGAALVGATGLSGAAARPAPAATGPAILKKRKPNILFISADQLGLDTISGHGCTHVKTPNMDRLIQRGVTFKESYSTNPICSPARSSWFTGRMPVETGVVSNGLPIDPSRPNLGQWLRQEGYETIYTGKWHIPDNYATEIEGFTLLPVGQGQGHLTDSVVARNCEAFLKQRDRSKPFLLSAALLQPHDICFFPVFYHDLIPAQVPFSSIQDSLPGLTPGHGAKVPEPRKIAETKRHPFSDLQWRYYNYVYDRQVEMLDIDIGRILDALEHSGDAENTIIVFTSDHGDSLGRHGLVGKWTPYDEAGKVPLIISWPGNLPEGLDDRSHLVSGMDIFPTVCELAGVNCAPMTMARSLEPILKDGKADWRDYLVYETQITGRVVCTADFKFVEFEDDPQRQLFDRRTDPWETSNLIADAARSQTIGDYQKLLSDWNAHMEPVPVPARRGRQAPE